MYVPHGTDIAFKILGKEMSKGEDSKFLVYYDPDIDGLLAGFLGQRFLSRFNKKSLYHINENRGHGFHLPESEWYKYKGYTILAVDFAITREELKNIISAGINIVSIDHHNIEDKFIYEKDLESGCEGVIINNQYPFEPEEYRFLSGAGVVYHVLSAILRHLGRYEEDKAEIALVGISLLSDIRPTETELAKTYLKETFTNQSPIIKYLVDVTTEETPYTNRNSFGLPTMNRNFIDYNFSPKLNSLFRLNKGDLAVKLIQGDVETRHFLKVENALKIYKDMQNHVVTEIMDNLKGKEYSHIIVKGVPKGFVSHYKELATTNFIGLACSRVRGDYKSTFLYVEGEEGIVQRGSVRGLYDKVDYLEIFKKHGVRGEGHHNAFGILPMRMSEVDFEALNAEIAQAEESNKKNPKRNERVLEVNDLGMFLKGPNKKYAEMNIYVRDAYRVYLRYTGSNIKENKRGKMIEYIIDGIPVKCFDLDLKVEDGLILPVYGNGDYIEFTLRKAFS